jgi:hypothetical protein
LLPGATLARCEYVPATRLACRTKIFAGIE